MEETVAANDILSTEHPAATFVDVLVDALQPAAEVSEVAVGDLPAIIPEEALEQSTLVAETDIEETELASESAVIVEVPAEYDLAAEKEKAPQLEPGDGFDADADLVRGAKAEKVEDAEAARVTEAAEASQAAEAAVAAALPVEEKSRHHKEDRQSSRDDVSRAVLQNKTLDAAPAPADTSAATAAADAAAAAVSAQPASQSAAPKAAPATSTGSPSVTAAHGPSPRLPPHVLGRPDQARGHSPAPVEIDSARFLTRVARAFLAAQDRGGEVRLRLSPPELGSLRLQISVQEGVMVARMETETESARNSLAESLPALRERLAEQGIRVERFDIDLMQRPSTGTPDRPGDPQNRDDAPHVRPLRPLSASGEDSSASTTPASSWNGQGRLNVIV